MKLHRLGWRRWSVSAVVGLAGAAGLAGGCASSSSDSKESDKHVVVSNLQVPAYDFNMPAQQLAQRIQQILAAPPLAIPVEKVEKGTILTGFKDYPGAWHIARRWEEQTRYRISVYPGFDNPTGTSHLEVVQETRTRASKQQPNWYTWAESQRPERAAELAKTLHDQIAGGAK